MRLPNMRYTDQIRKQQQLKFGGLNHTTGAGDGELWDMRNLTSDHYPLLATRSLRRKHRQLESPLGIFCREKLCWVDGSTFYYDGAATGLTELNREEKHFAALGSYIVILPDKMWYNTRTGECGLLEAEWSGKQLTFTNGLYKEEEADANTLQAEGVDWSAYFRVGDGVTIEGCTKHPDNNKTPIIREIDGDKLYFYENVFVLDGEDGTTPYTETGEIKISRKVPDLRFICENENRLWACDRDTIYASKWGDIFNWNVMEGLETDSYAAPTGSAGEFTACTSYMGYPIFFKEDHIYKVYGSVPSNFEVMGSATLGVAPGSDRSLAVAGEVLFYLSRAGVMAYSGGVPQPVGGAFGTERHKKAVGGSDGLKYYVRMESEEGCLLYVYDVQRRLWHIEDESDTMGFAWQGGNLYMLCRDGGLWLIGNLQDAPVGEAEADFEWSAEFCDFTEEDPNKKGVSKLQIRLELEDGAEAEVLLQMDSDGIWQKAGPTMIADRKRSWVLPIVPRRCDHYRLKIRGKGGCRIHSIVRESYSGSELRRH